MKKSLIIILFLVYPFSLVYAIDNIKTTQTKQAMTECVKLVNDQTERLGGWRKEFSFEAFYNPTENKIYTFDYGDNRDSFHFLKCMTEHVQSTTIIRMQYNP